MTSINNNNLPYLNNTFNGNVNQQTKTNNVNSELFTSRTDVNYTFTANPQTSLERVLASDEKMSEIYSKLTESELANVRFSQDPDTIKINGTEPWYQGLYEGKAFDRTVTVNRGGVKTEATYNSDGKITDVKSSDGTSIQYEYAEDGTVAKEVFTNKNGVKTTTIFSTQTLQLTEASSNQTTSATTKTTSTTTTSTKTSTAAVAADDGFGSSTSAYEIQRSKKTGKITGINFQSKQALDNYNPPATSTANAKVPIHISNKFSTTFLQYDSEGKLMGIVDYKGNLVKDMSQQEVEIKYITEEGQKILDYLQGKEINLTEDEAKKIFDINGDGRVTINDATASQRKGQNDTALNIQRYLAEFGVNLTQSEAVKLFDTDGDGKVTEKDTYKYYVNGDPSASSQISYSQNISSYINGSRTMKLSSEAAIRMYDIDGDGKVTINDATEMQRIQQSINKGSSTSSTVNLDINGDGKIDSKDSDAAGNITTNIQRYLAEFDVTLSDSEAKKAFDLDGNGIIDEADLNQAKTGRYTIQIGKATFITTNLNIKNEVDKIDKNSEKLARIIQHYIAKQENQFVFNSEEDLYKYFDLDMNGRIDIQDATYAQLGYPKDPPKPALTPDPDPIPEPTPEPEPEPDPNPIPEPDPEYDPERDDNPNASKHKRRK